MGGRFHSYQLSFWASALALLPLSASAIEKQGMPDLCQVEQTCLPTSTANLIIWFGKHGYPKLIPPGSSEDERDLSVVHGLMRDTEARFDFGTEPEKIDAGIDRYIHESGYQCNVDYRGCDAANRYSQEWLKENDNPEKGFILLLRYCRYDRTTGSFVPSINAGHAVTLVNAEDNMLLIHDPAHYEDETGRKLLTPELLDHGTWSYENKTYSTAGMMLLRGDLLDTIVEDGCILLHGAVCITMHPPSVPGSAPAKSPDALSTLAGASNSDDQDAPVSPGGNSAGPAAPAQESWATWLLHLFLTK